MLSKPDMWESEEFRLKFSKIPRHLQGKFLRGIQDLYRQESNSMLDFIRQSRNSLRLTATEIKDEQEVLQQTFRKLSDERTKNRIDVGDNPNPRRETSNMSTRSYPPQPRRHKPYCPSPEPMGQPGYPRPMDKLPPLAGRTTMHFENEENFDMDEEEDYFKEETQEIMRAESRANNFHENERARQLEKIEQLKKQKMAKKEAQQEVAQEMIREASFLEKQKKDEKKKQEEKMRQKLEEKKRQREMTGLGGGRMSSASVLPDVDTNVEIVRTPRPRSPADIARDTAEDAATPVPPGAEAAEAADESSSKKDKKKKKKDKKEKKEKKDKKSKKNKEEAVEELAA